MSKTHLQFIRQHFPQLLLPQHVEALVQHLPLVLHVGPDGPEGQAEVQASVLDVAADSVQLWVGEVKGGGLFGDKGQRWTSAVFQLIGTRRDEAKIRIGFTFGSNNINQSFFLSLETSQI